ncbi:hypothetical protein ES288_D09G081600v1 [Gossypium darwinii]|uniref:Uncharacterized protein n=1 Tax=Gossypium darwinii TaxID=34276 RepID=A0A5D2B992_GOSDA|nr:hypothetical protein ES288_D09G081600v1 [Gossypium darwinii]
MSWSTGEKGIGPKTGKPLHYKGSFFHRVMKGSLAQGGDFGRRDGMKNIDILSICLTGWPANVCRNTGFIWL